MTVALRWSGAGLALSALLAVVGCGPEQIENLDDCSADAFVVGAANEFQVQEFSFKWQTRSAKDGMVGLTKPLSFALPSDLISVVFTLDDPGNVPIIAETMLDGRIVTTEYDYSGQQPNALSRGTGAWPNAISFGLPSNAKTIPGSVRCLEIEVMSSAGELNVENTLYVTSVRRSSRQLGQYFDIQARVLDDAISEEELVALNSDLQKLFGRACGSGECPMPHMLDEWGRFTTDLGTGDVVIDDEMAPGNIFYDIASATNEELGRGINIVFVNGLYLDAIDDDLTLLGLAGGIPAAPFDGTGASSLFISVDAHRNATNGLVKRDFLASTVAHELGHMLGLFHPTESDGKVFDPIADTPECPASKFDLNKDGRVMPGECFGAGADNLMFWAAEDGPSGSLNRISPEQSVVLRSHPLMYLDAE